ncbi:MAG: hypothetical protein QNJ00_08120 [Woeseiaceae bacterium]|nr:hypothetical protein [Woeseiaceae bacterium]
MTWRQSRHVLLPLVLILSACSQQPPYPVPSEPLTGPMPVNLSGYWERDYSRGNDVNAELRRLFTRLGPDDLRYPGGTAPGFSASQADTIMALAQFTDEITRHDVLEITQTDTEISVHREEDYDLLCEFYQGLAKATDSDYGYEVCGWDGEQLVSNLNLPDGLLIRHRFTISDDRNYLRITTTVASKASRVPFTLERYYRRFLPPNSDFNCIETLSMKRVCSTGEIER